MVQVTRGARLSWKGVCGAVGRIKFKSEQRIWVGELEGQGYFFYKKAA